jgi:hypothetical protein
MSFADADGPALAGEGFSDYLPRQDPTGDVSGPKAGAPKPFDPGAPDGFEGGMSESDFGPSMEQPAAQKPPAQSHVRPRQQPQQQPPQDVRRARPDNRIENQPPREHQPYQDQPQPQQAPEQVEDWSAFGFLPMEVEQLQQFLQQMNMALISGHTAPQLAESFLQTYPIDVIGQMVGAIDMPRFIGAIRQCAHTRDLVLASGKGRRFLSDTWEILQERVDQAAGQAQAPSQAPPAPQQPAPESPTEPENEPSGSDLVQVNPEEGDES